MVIIALADIHDNIKRLGAIAYDLSTADVVLLVGDLTNFGRKEAASKVVSAVKKYSNCVLAVPGNCDYPEVDAYLTDEGVNLHRKSIVIDESTFLGVGGSLPCPSKTPNELTEAELGAFLRETVSNLNPDAPMILVSHQPPCNTVVDFARNGRHVGSESICNFIAEIQPMICFTGHIHEARGIDTIGKTKVVNPGPLREGGYAYAEVSQQVDVLEIRGIDSV